MIVPEEIGSFYVDQKATSLIAELKDLIARYGDSVYIDKQYYKYDNGEYYAAFFKRPETDEEFAKRTNDDKLRNQLREKQEREQFEKLRVKYG